MMNGMELDITQCHGYATLWLFHFVLHSFTALNKKCTQRYAHKGRSCMILKGTGTYIIKVQTDVQAHYAYCVLQMPSID